MRLFVLLPLSCIAILWCGSCGGGQSTREAAQSAGPTSAADAAPPSPPSTPEGGAPAPGPVNTPTASASASASVDAAPPPKAPHTHDPGRGIDDINAIVKGHRDEARACYDKALADHPGIEGDLVITWTIDPKGVVTKTAPDVSRSTIAEPTVFACISDIIKKIQFAPSPGGFETKASYPFNFHPRRSKQTQ